MTKPSREYLYGLNPAFEVFRAKRRRVLRALLLDDKGRNPRLAKLAALAGKHGVTVERVDRGRLHDLARSREHQGVVLQAEPYAYTESGKLFARPRLLLLDNVEDPHNVGAILRSAEIFGFDSVLLPTRGVPEIYPSVVKVSAGATEFLAIARDSTTNRYVVTAREHGFRVVALDGGGPDGLRETAAALSDERVLLVIGGENHAVGQFVLNSADHVVRIAQEGRVNSLNASVAAGIALFAFSAKGAD
ncbi:MAG: RNA methyltransferase [Gemmatimonadota bacterium]|nr:RNA methyltransferase [Gemmatimonadota bacterium]